MAIFVLVGGRVNRWGKKMVVSYENDGYYYGDLFKMSDLTDFKIPLKKFGKTELHTATSSRIFTMGDSFFQVDAESEIFAERLEKEIKKPVFDLAAISTDPLAVLQKIGYQKGEEKVLVLESIERYVPANAAGYGKTSEPSNKSKFKKAVNRWCWALFNNTDMDYFFSHNRIIYPLRTLVADFKYRVLGMVNYRVRALSKDPVKLFYGSEVLSSRRNISDEDIRRFAQSIKKLSVDLKEKYNLVLVYVAVPNSYSIYYDLDESGFGFYNQFLPRLQKELANLQVNFFDLYSLYVDYRAKGGQDLLYFANDSHYNSAGKEILVKATAEKIKEMATAGLLGKL